MSDINKIELLLNDLKELWLKNPDLKLCQLLSYVAFKGGWYNNALFYVGDDIIAKGIKKSLYKDRKGIDT